MTRLTAAIVLALPTLAFAWGGEGHQIVALIAEKHLTPQAHAAAKELLGDGADISDAEVVTWADEVRRSTGTLRPTNASTPMANAMSVAIGMAHPCTPGPPTLIAAKISAGTSMPPMAAATGRVARRIDASSPSSSSRLISKPTRRKKTTISPSLTQCSRDIERPTLPAVIASVVCQKCA
jgi:hypothetical protein